MGHGAREAWLVVPVTRTVAPGSAVAGPDAAVAQARAQVRWSEVGPAPRKLTPLGRARLFRGSGARRFAQRTLDRWPGDCYTHLLMGSPVLLRGGDPPC